MPFIATKCREAIRKDGPKACKEVGDICFIFYEEMMKQWRGTPRWKTAHRLKKEFVTEPETNDFIGYVYRELPYGYDFSESDVLTAAELAYDVFFAKHVLNYENLKEMENGTI